MMEMHRLLEVGGNHVLNRRICTWEPISPHDETWHQGVAPCIVQVWMDCNKMKHATLKSQLPKEEDILLPDPHDPQRTRFTVCGNPKRSWRVILATYQEPRSKLVNGEWPEGSRPLKWWMDPQLIYDASQTTRQETNKTPAADTDVSGNLFCTNAKCTRNVLTWRLGSIKLRTQDMEG